MPCQRSVDTLRDVGAGLVLTAAPGGNRRRLGFAALLAAETLGWPLWLASPRWKPWKVARPRCSRPCRVVSGGACGYGSPWSPASTARRPGAPDKAPSARPGGRAAGETTEIVQDSLFDSGELQPAKAPPSASR